MKFWQKASLVNDDGDVSDGGDNTTLETSSTVTDSPSIAASPHWKVPVHPAVHGHSTTLIGDHQQKGFSPFVAFCFTINYILGCGFLSIPWAFVQSGLVLSSVLLVLSAILSDVAKDYVLETMARAEVMLDDQMHWINKDKKDKKKKGAASEANGPSGRRLLLVPPAKKRGEEEHLLLLQYQKEDSTDPVSSYDSTTTTSTTNKQDISEQDRDTNFHRSSSLPAFVTPEEEEMIRKVNPYHHHDSNNNKTDGEYVPFSRPHHSSDMTTKYLVGERKFEVNALCRVFLQKKGLTVYTIIISLYMCGALWAYVSVFSSAMATAIPIVHDDVTRTAAELYGLNYLVYAIIFGCIVVPLSCLELDEQVPVQVALTGCRFLMFFLMIGTSHLAAEDQEDVLLSTGQEDSVESIHAVNEPDSFNWSGLPKTLPILIFANIFHHSIPGLTSPVADKKKIGGVFTATNAFTTSSYLILGLTLGTAFGKGIHQSSNLNWNSFNAGTGDIDDRGNVINGAWWTHAISMYIIIFPALDVVSAYPLNAITLGNNLFNAVYGKRIHEVEKNRFLRTCFRLLASVPPIIFGILVRQLGTITDYTGTFGFLIGLSFPAILYITSKKMAKRKHYNVDTYYTRFGSNNTLATAIFWFGVVMMLAMLFILTFGEKFLGI